MENIMTAKRLSYISERGRAYKMTSEHLKKESSKLVIELSNLGSGSMRTVKRELKVLIEDYAWKKMVSGSINVKEEK